MGRLFRVYTEDDRQLGHARAPLHHVFEDHRFLRSQPDDEAGAFLRGAMRVERETLPFFEARHVLTAMRRVEARALELQARLPPEQARARDIVYPYALDGRRMWKVRVRTGFSGGSVRWDANLERPSAADDAWCSISEGTEREHVMRLLGDVPVRDDGSVVRPAHLLRRFEANPEWWARPFEKTEREVELRFLRPTEQPDWRSLLAELEAEPTRLVCLRAG